MNVKEEVAFSRTGFSLLGFDFWLAGRSQKKTGFSLFYSKQSGARGILLGFASKRDSSRRSNVQKN